MFKPHVVIVAVAFVCLINARIESQEQSPSNAISVAAWSTEGFVLGGYIEQRLGLTFYDAFGQETQFISLAAGARELAWQAWEKPFAVLVDTPDNMMEIQTYLPDGTLQSIIPVQNPSNTDQIAWNPSGNLLAVSRGAFQIWNAATGTLAYTLTEEAISPSDIYAFAWFSDDEILVSSRFETVYLWTLSTGAIVEFYNALSQPHVMELSSDRRLLAIGMSPLEGDQRVGIVEIVHLDSRHLGALIQTSHQAISGLAWSPDNSQIAVAGVLGGEGWDIFSIQTGKQLSTIEAVNNVAARVVTYSPYGGQILYSTGAAHRNTEGIVPNRTDINAQPSEILNISGVEIVVPSATAERFAEIAAFCNAPISLTTSAEDTSLQAQSGVTQGQALLAQLDALPDDAIRPGCEADLRAIAEAIQAQ